MLGNARLITAMNIIALYMRTALTLNSSVWRFRPPSRKLKPRTNNRLNSTAPTSEADTIAYKPAFNATTPMMISGRLPNIVFSRAPIESPV